jgi:lipopolysaccharide/colanic/teichoic acid biosynthesis glycosyltransferase
MRPNLYIGATNSKLIREFKKPELITIQKNGLLAMHYLNSTLQKPSIIFCEEKISGINALELCSMIKKTIGCADVVFILIGQSVCKIDVKKAISFGIDEVLDQNTSLEEVMPRLKFLLLLKKTSNSKEQEKNESKKVELSKRIFDVVVASSALILLSPILIITAIALKFESKDPLFYASKRVGSHYQIFNFYKFRSMVVGAENKLNNMKSLNQYATTKKTIKLDDKCNECNQQGQPCSPMLFVDQIKVCEKHYQKVKLSEEAGTFIKIKDDPRITKIGKFIRNTSIDELPQLINVLKGDMSIVGNRPLPLYEAELLTSDRWADRFSAPAGITGLWQVEKRGSGSMSEEERKQLDNRYAQKRSFLFDITLLIKTVPALFQSENV